MLPKKWRRLDFIIRPCSFSRYYGPLFGTPSWRATLWDWTEEMFGINTPNNRPISSMCCTCSQWRHERKVTQVKHRIRADYRGVMSTRLHLYSAQFKTIQKFCTHTHQIIHLCNTHYIFIVLMSTMQWCLFSISNTNAESAHSVKACILAEFVYLWNWTVTLGSNSAGCVFVPPLAWSTYRGREREQTHHTHYHHKETFPLQSCRKHFSTCTKPGTFMGCCMVVSWTV